MTRSGAQRPRASREAGPVDFSLSIKNSSTDCDPAKQIEHRLRNRRLLVGFQNLVDDRQYRRQDPFGPHLPLPISRRLNMRQNFVNVCQPSLYFSQAARWLRPWTSTS